MKRTLFACIFVCLFSSPIFAQWGVKGGMNQSKFTALSDVGYRTGFDLGVLYDKKLGRISYLQTGLSFVSYGTRLKKNAEMSREKGYVNMYGLEFPFIASLRPHITKNTSIVIDAGLFFRYGLFGNRLFSSTDFEDPSILYQDKGSTFNGYRRFDMGINLGVGMKHKQYTIGIAYLHGINGVEENWLVYNKMWRVNIIYSF